MPGVLALGVRNTTSEIDKVTPVLCSTTNSLPARSLSQHDVRIACVEHSKNNRACGNDSVNTRPGTNVQTVLCARRCKQIETHQARNMQP